MLVPDKIEDWMKTGFSIEGFGGVSLILEHGCVENTRMNFAWKKKIKGNDKLILNCEDELHLFLGCNELKNKNNYCLFQNFHFSLFPTYRIELRCSDGSPRSQIVVGRVNWPGPVNEIINLTSPAQILVYEFPSLNMGWRVQWAYIINLTMKCIEIN